MNFALIGDAPEVLPLLRAIGRSATHRLTRAALVTDTLPEILQACPAVQVSSDWTTLLVDSSLDVVIVAGCDEAAQTAARELAVAGVAIALFPEAAQGSTFLYQLTLIRDDTHGVMLPVLPLHVHPAVIHLQELIRAQTLGKVLYLQFEREIAQPTLQDGVALQLSIADIDAALLPDVDLMRLLAGPYDQVTALHTGRTADGLSLASVTLAGHDLPEASWSAKASARGMRRLTLTGEQGTADIDFDAPQPILTVHADGSRQQFESASETDQCGLAMLERIEHAFAEQPVKPDWADLTKVFETVDATHRSIRRRRTIDLHFETTSERSIFKTQMTAIGCGVLTFTLLGMIAYLLVGQMFAADSIVLQVVRVLWIAPLIIFLLLQFLVVIARPSAVRPTKQTSELPSPE